ncbi:MAG: PAS domain-containing protein [Thermodesulfobacteriota bacterium]
MGNKLARFIPIADAITAILRPHAEVVIHDVKEDAIFYITNPFSGREVGDPSNLKINTNDFNLNKDVIGPYEKTGANGQHIRSITAVLRDSTGNTIGILCINLDFLVLSSALSVLERFILPQDIEARPEMLFRNEWKELILLEIRSFSKDSGQSIENLNAQGRKLLLERLDEKGLFYARKSVEQVAVHLGMSRATIYKDLQKIRKGKKTTSDIVVGL